MNFFKYFSPLYLSSKPETLSYKRQKMTQTNINDYRWRWLLALLLGLCIWSQASFEAKAHGAYINTRNTTTVEIEAKYDSGEPLAEAQVLIYSPTDAESARFEGVTDLEGKYSFSPDQPGSWEVTVRVAGHGAVTTIPVSETGAVTASLSANSQLSPLQKTITMGAIIWGFIGTALYFQRKKR